MSLSLKKAFLLQMVFYMPLSLSIPHLRLVSYSYIIKTRLWAIYSNELASYSIDSLLMHVLLYPSSKILATYIANICVRVVCVLVCVC